jgi:hypothetical protein
MGDDSRGKRLSAIGYWRVDEAPLSFPHPKELIDPSWTPEERMPVADYLAGGVSLGGYFGFSHCRFADGPPDEEMGTDDLTDGTWVWPQALAMYVQRYSVRVPDAFVASAQQRNYQMPADLDIEELRTHYYSYATWKWWVFTHRSNRVLALLSIPCLFINY